MIPASKLDWADIQRFSPGEWPKNTLPHLSSQVILELARIRSLLPPDHIVKPSPLRGAHVRESGDSRHSTRGGTRLSDATDLFLPGGWKHALAFWVEAQRNPLIGGLGLYVNRWYGSKESLTPMVHIDLREERLLWVCRDNPVDGRDEYIYLHNNPFRFFEVLSHALR